MKKKCEKKEKYGIFLLRYLPRKYDNCSFLSTRRENIVWTLCQANDWFERLGSREEEL